LRTSEAFIMSGLNHLKKVRASTQKDSLKANCYSVALIRMTLKNGRSVNCDIGHVEPGLVPSSVSKWESRGNWGVVAIQAYLKVRARVLDRHKRLYLVCTGETHTLFMLPVASICKHNKSGRTISHRTIRSPKR